MRFRHRSSTGSGGPSVSPTRGVMNSGISVTSVRVSPPLSLRTASIELGRNRAAVAGSSRPTKWRFIARESGRLQKPRARRWNPFLAVALDIVQGVARALHLARERLGRIAETGPPRPLHQEVRARRDAHAVQAHVEIVRGARAPELPRRAVFGAGAPVAFAAREAELDVVAGQLTDPVAQIVGEVVVRRARGLPGGIGCRPVGVDVGNDRPGGGAPQGGAVLAGQIPEPQALQESLGPTGSSAWQPATRLTCQPTLADRGTPRSAAPCGNGRSRFRAAVPGLAGDAFGSKLKQALPDQPPERLCRPSPGTSTTLVSKSTSCSHIVPAEARIGSCRIRPREIEFNVERQVECMHVPERSSNCQSNPPVSDPSIEELESRCDNRNRRPSSCTSGLPSTVNS